MASLDLTDRVAIVTGGSQGIGRAIALAFAEAGAGVAVVARLPEPKSGRGRGRLHLPVEPVVEQIERMERRALGITADLRDEAQVAGMVRQVQDRLGRVDMLVNVAGGTFGETFRTGPLLEMTETDVLETFRTNMMTMLLCSKAVVPAMKQQGKGAIVNIASGAGRAASPGMGAYAAAKAAIINLTQTMAVEWAPEIRVNAIAPSIVDTPHSPPNDPEPEPRRQPVGVPLGRLGATTDIASAALYLASDAASYVSGTILEVHGGGRR
jgi:3-oxoacyl-[acyl-carrier protein] reductase